MIQVKNGEPTEPLEHTIQRVDGEERIPMALG